MANSKDIKILKWFGVLTFLLSFSFSAGSFYAYSMSIEPQLVSINKKLDGLTESEVSNRIAIAQLAIRVSNYERSLDKLENRLNNLR